MQGMAMKAKRKASRAPYRLATAGKEGILFLPGFITERKDGGDVNMMRDLSGG
jgi:hypothetical protein